MTVPFKVKAVFEYKSEDPDDLNFENGQIITVTEEEDADWYTGEFVDAAGNKVDGIFPRNFVEKYEPAIPTRPNRTPRKPTLPEIAVESSIQEAAPLPVSQATHAPEPEVSNAKAPAPAPTATQESIVEPPVRQLETKPAVTKQPPAVVEKPNTSSFRDRIAAFNKPAAAPITPFKPSNVVGGGTGFVKKAFVAPPPSRNAYVPPPTQAAPPQKIYRREEDPDMRRNDENEVSTDNVAPVQASAPDDQPKPTSLKDRIALLQQQQLEQAARNAEKRKPKKPPTKRTESADTLEEYPVDHSEDTVPAHEMNDTLDKTSHEIPSIEEEDSLESSEASKAEPVISTPVPPPPRELVSDTNDADDSEAGDTEDARDVSGDEEIQRRSSVKAPVRVATNATTDDAQDEEEDTEDEDPEVRRRRELRERMAKMSGGMGMMGMFGPPGGASAPARKMKTSRESDEPSRAGYEEDVTRAPPVPVMALPGMGAPPRHEAESDGDDGEDTAAPTPVESKHKDDDEDYVSLPRRTSTDHSLARSPPAVRGVPPPPPRESRPAPPLPSSPPTLPREAQSPPARGMAPPPPTPARPTNDDSEDEIDHPVLPPAARTSIDRQSSTKARSMPGAPPIPPNRPYADETSTDVPPVPTADTKAGRAPPPPVPGARPASPTSRAPPPPPPPSNPPSRAPTSGALGLAEAQQPGGESDEEVTEYEGDYDTDIASGAKHKAALKAHNRNSSVEDEGTLTDDASKPPEQAAPRAMPPPPPPTAPPRDVPPQLPTTAAKSRKSSEVPRGPPPPVPMTRPDAEDYDPFNYSTASQGLASPSLNAPQSPPRRSATIDREDPDLYGAPQHPPLPRMPPPPTGGIPPLPTERSLPPPPPPSTNRETLQPPSSMANNYSAEQPKASLDVARAPMGRRSVEVPRPSADYGFIASDLDLAESTAWWTQENTLPPSLQGRNDILFEAESNTSSKRGGRTMVNKDIYILYMDYSQTTVNISFDPSDPRSASLQQSHERPPPPPRQDQLESASGQFGAQIASAAQGVAGSSVGDGTAPSLVLELLRPFASTVLMPIGIRSYGALVYANLANASTQQFDEIRPGDVVTFRNAKFGGHKGLSKYSMDVGKPDHVAVVIDWDGTKKKIRAWEQGREEKGKKTKVHDESFRVGDLKSGEVRVWRVMPRSWVGWDKS